MNVQLDPQDKQRIEELARESGKEPDELLRELVHEALQSRKQNGTAGSEDPEAAWKSFLSATSEWSRRLPEGHQADDSRESIYAGRGE